jgi:hypothetical protein
LIPYVREVGFISAVRQRRPTLATRTYFLLQGRTRSALASGLKTQRWAVSKMLTMIRYFPKVLVATMDYEVRVTIGEFEWYHGVKDGLPYGGGFSDLSDEFHANVQSVLLHFANQNQNRLDRSHPIHSCEVRVLGNAL